MTGDASALPAGRHLHPPEHAVQVHQLLDVQLGHRAQHPNGADGCAFRAPVLPVTVRNFVGLSLRPMDLGTLNTQGGRGEAALPRRGRGCPRGFEIAGQTQLRAETRFFYSSNIGF